MEYVIVMDSCGECTAKMKEDERVISAPLTLQVDDHIIIDDDTFDQADFLRKVAESPNCPKSACPSPDHYKEAFEKAEKRAYGVTLTAELSGSYNSAMLARDLVLEERPELQIHIFNSRSASVGETLITEKIQECEEAGMDFEQVVETVEAYIEEQHTYFVLENLDTLRKNGRLTGLKSLVVSALNIKPVMGSTPEGTICQLDKSRGMKKALAKMAEHVAKDAVKPEEKILAIAHCNCPERAEVVRKLILEKVKVKDSFIVDTAGISSMYANDGGIIVVL